MNKRPDKPEGAATKPPALIGLNDLASLRVSSSKWDFLVLLAQMSGFQTDSKVGPSSTERDQRRLALELEEAAMDAIHRLEGEARGGNHAAARALHRVAEFGVFSLNACAHDRLDIFRPVAVKAIGWPAMYSDMRDERVRDDQLIKDLQVGKESSVKAIQVSTRPPKWSERKVINRLTMRYFANLKTLAVVAGLLAPDGPTLPEFERRCNALLQQWQVTVADPSVRVMLLEIYRRGLECVEKDFPDLIWMWLQVESEGWPERVRELREKSLNNDVLLRDEGSKLAERILTAGKSNTPEAIFAYLSENIASPAVEKEIQTQMRKRIMMSMAWAASPPPAM